MAHWSMSEAPISCGAESMSRPTRESTNTLTPLTYRPDIDGLRGLSILSVIVFHYFPRVAPGGFVGRCLFRNFGVPDFRDNPQILESRIIQLRHLLWPSNQADFSFACHHSCRFPSSGVGISFPERLEGAWEACVCRGSLLIQYCPDA